ncbi:MAG TPA: hypothetical protein VKE51_14120, partial [Vicinamibacterales bacterium]|nr:hypothetical protein [Vicinamibacterales bacterium]
GDGERSVNIARQGYETERIGGDYMAMYRFFVPVLPLTFALIGVAVECAIADAEAATARRRVLEVLGTASVCGLLLQSTPYEAAVFAPPPRMHGTYRGVQTERWHVRRFHVIGDFFNTASDDARDSIFTYDIGVVGYVTAFRIYDALGVVDRTIAHSAPPATAGQGMAGHEKQDLDYS